MVKVCLFTFTLLSICLMLCSAEHYVKTKIEHDRFRRGNKAEDAIEKLHDIEEKLSKLRSLLRDPIDEEHERLEKESDETHAHEWTLQLNSDNIDEAKKLASKYGFDHVSKMDVGYGVFRFTHVKKDTKKNKAQTSNVVEEEEKVISKRDDIEGIIKHLASDSKVRWYSRERILEREKRVPIVHEKKSASDNGIFLNDPSFKYQWYIKNDGQTSGPAGFDSGIEPVWKSGIFGRNIVLSVLDDGMDHTHPELKDNYDPQASTDLNGHKADPFPNDSDPYNAHGTKCAGTIAAKANDSLCGVGIAPESKIGAIRMLDGKATDGIEANALSFRRNHIDIYSCSWGPKDNGQTFGRPGRLGRIALHQGALYGRNGKGSLFIWATGNGGMSYDDCNADGYVNSIYTLGIGAANEHGVSTYYGERCSAMFAVTYCSGKHSSYGSKNPKADIITTYLHHKCTNHFVGTSSAAPLAAGIFALVLEANKNITWRDLQHLVFNTTIVTSPNDLGWKKNGVGKQYNHKFGFGVLNAEKLVKAALNWVNVPAQRSCHFRLQFDNGNIPSRQHFRLSFKTDGCQSCSGKKAGEKCKNAVEKLEHVVVNITLKHRRRGDLSVQLISPNGTVSNLLHQRPYDGSSAGLKGWSFMTVFNWGENPNGTWKLIFTDNNQTNSFSKVTRDLEEEYVEELDRKKIKDEVDKKIVKDARQDSEVERTVKAKEDLYKREMAKLRQAYEQTDNRAFRSFKRDESPYDRSTLYDEYGHVYDYDGMRGANYDYDDYHRRSKRSVRTEDDVTDYVKYKKDKIGSYKFEYESDELRKSELAGVVTDIAVTFYGTA